MGVSGLEGLAIPPGGLAALGSPPAQGPVAFDRIEGMLLGLAIGDALGNTSEGQNPGERRARWGEIRDYLPNRHAGDARVGLPSDDTQLAFWTLKSLLEHGRAVPEDLAARFARQRIFGIGQSMRAFLRAYRAGLPWQQAAQRSAGNGALMRIAPVVMPHIAKPSPDLWVDAILAGAVTHNDPSSIAACVALTGILWEALAMDGPPAPAWWLDATRDNDTVAAIVGAVVGALHGRRGLPERWVAGLLGRTAEADGGRVFDLIRQARARFGLGET